jgi:hypothetical protein
VLEWADAHGDAWAWSWLRALSLWSLDRREEAADLLTALGDAPDFAPAYATRGLLLEEVRGADPIPDLRRAVRMDPANRILHVALIQKLQERSLWEESVAALADARTRFDGDFNLALLQARTFLWVGRAEDATRILSTIQVLPSENGRESHRLWAWAHTLVALDALEAGDAEGAQSHLRSALEWPESLGQGRPYEPEERLVRYLLGVAEGRLGDDAAAREEFEAVVAASTAPDAPGAMEPTVASRLDLLAVPALTALGRAADPRHVAAAPAALFEDLEGRILRRALDLRGSR